jgi:hypothetical protein
MPIIFTGGRLANRADPADPAFIIPDSDARAAVWRDFLEGLHPFERLFFTPPDRNGRIGVNGLGGAAQQFQHDHVLMLMEAAQRSDRTIFVMPAPVFQAMPERFRWVTQVATGEIRRGFRIHINGYGRFPVEWLDLRTAAGRTHRVDVNADREACVYATRLVGRPVANAVARKWRRRRNGLDGVRPSDTAERFFDREHTATLFHELLFHCIQGFDIHDGGAVDAIEDRARQNWLADNPPR